MNDVCSMTQSDERKNDQKESGHSHTQDRLIGLAPVIDEHTRVLIVGSFPSAISLTRNEYYANPRNDFWRIMSMVLNMPPDLAYESRIRYLLEMHVGLWDVITSCTRPGSLDTSIRNPIASDIDSLLFRYPKITTIITNGRKAESEMKKIFGSFSEKEHSLNIRRMYLPSTSPAHAIRLADKAKAWMILRTIAEQAD